jgi:CelD/BcsL family acetyltransferase involved in cellulose biosynthesis
VTGAGRPSSRVVAVADMTDDDRAAWADLVRRAIDPYPFLDPRLLVPAVELLPRAADLRVLVVEEGGRFLGLMPVAIRPRGAGRLTVTSTEHPFLGDESGWDHPLVDAGRATEVMTELLRGVRRGGLPGLVDIARMPADGPLHRALLDAAAGIGAPAWERERQLFAFARRPDGPAPGAGVAEEAEAAPEFLLPHFGSDSRKHHRRWARALEAEAGAPLRLVDRSGDPSAISDFIDLEDAGWKGDASKGGWGIRLRGAGEWLTEMTARFRADGDLRVLALVGGDALVFMSINVRYGANTFGYASAYDERFSEARAGNLGMVATINRMLAEPGTVDFDPNYEVGVVASRRFYSDERPRVRMLVAAHGVGARAAVRILPRLRELRRRGRP